MNQLSSNPLSNHHYFTKLSPVVLIICIGFLEQVFFLQTLNDFWFDDDSTLFAFVAGIKSPHSFFLSQDVIAASGFSFTPMQFLSYWIDLRLGGLEPFIAYIHSCIVFLSTATMLFIVLRFSQSVRFSLIVTIAWMFLPSTIAIQEFIGARHYMEGLFLTLCSLFFCYKSFAFEKPSSRFYCVCLSLVYLFFAMLCKEVFVTSGPLFVFILFVSKKRYKEAISVVLISVLYTCYRLWAIGLSSKYPIPTMELEAYLVFLTKLPFIFTGNSMGYLLFGGVFFCGLLLAIQRNLPYVIISILVVSIVINLITIYPGSAYLSNDWQNLGTWYRLPFLLNLIFLLGGCFLFKHAPRQFITVMCLVLLVSLSHGSNMTRKQWHSMKDRYAVTGKYYIKNKDKLVYSEVPAYWYLGGLKSLYHLKHPFVLSHMPNIFQYDAAKNITEIWRYQNGEMSADPELWSHLKGKHL